MIINIKYYILIIVIKNIAMTMQDWKDKLDSFLEFNEREILKDNGKISKKNSRYSDI